MSETKSPASAAPGLDASHHEPAYVLAFDTANEVIAIGVGMLNAEARAIELVAHAEIEARRQSNTQLIPRIDALLAENGIARGDIACVCVGRGPGSFTGVRIAMATAKGIASALEVGLVGVSSLDAVAWGVWESGARGEVAVVADAMRKEVYPVRYRVDGAGAHRLEADRVVKADLAAEELAECDAATSGASDACGTRFVKGLESGDDELLSYADAPEAGGHAPRAVPQRSEDCLSTEYAPHSREQRETLIQPRLRQLSRLASLRHAQRERKGGIDFDQPEARVKLDEAGRPQGVELRRKNTATSLVEEMMIWANEVVAEHLSRAKFPCVYRVHEAPDLEGLAQLVPIFEEFPWFGKIDPVGFFTGSQHALQQAVSASRGRAEGELVSSLVLRSMKRAVYREKNCGHYGLASATYCHFTSPIRRYPDLMVHRMLKAELFGRPEKFDQMTTNLGWICEHSSGMEREADDAQRESEELKLAEYLQQFVGQSFSAIVSGVSQGGLYARLENTAEGFIPVRTLGDDYFSFDAARYTLTGEETGARYRLGQRIAVVLFAVDPRVPQIDLRLAQGSKR